jgi:hypothetical protein
MKLNIKFFFTLTVLLILCGKLFSQEDNQLGRVPGFVKSERLLPHYREGNTLANTGYGVDLANPVKFVSMPIPAGTPLTTINNNFGNYLIVGANIDNAGDYIGCTQVNQGYSELILVNVDTGVPFYLASITGFSYYATSLAYNSSNSTWYFGSSNNAESRLYSLNILTGSLTYIGQITGLAGLISLAIDCDGNAYGIDIVTDQLFSINLSTGAGTAIGPLGFNANFAQDADFDAATNTLYLAAFNNGISQGEFRSIDVTTGSSTLITVWLGSQITGFAIDNSCVNPCPIGASSNPNPPNGATNVPVYLNTASWTNGAGTTNVELWFGSWGYFSKIYDGPAITSYSLPWLSYSTRYHWVVICKDANCRTQGQIWTFTTEAEPFPGYWCEDFNSFSNWTIVGPLGMTNWSAANSSSAGGTAPELRMSWTPSFNGVSKIRSIVLPLSNSHGYDFSFNFYFDWFADPSGTVTVGITYDGGATSNILYSVTDPTGNIGPMIVSGSFATPSSGSQNAQVEITFSGNSFNNDNIYWDNLCIDMCLSCVPPYAPSNLTAQVIFNPNPQVQLGWQDHSWNEYGFKIYRKYGNPNDPGNYEVIDTVYNNITQYIDATVLPESTYTYRVFAYNQYGQNGSNTATIAVPVPVELISFTAEVDDKVITLFWQTATETNNQGFEIERTRLRSSNYAEASWERIRFVEGKGTTTEIQSYSFTDKPEPGKYKYRLKQLDFDGTFAYSPEVEVEVKAPNVFSLEQNYPNPFNPSTVISYQLPVTSNVTLKVFDILGNEVATLVDENKPAGRYEVEFNTSSIKLLPSSGIYFYQLLVSALQSKDGKAGDYIETRKMVLLK